MRLNVVGSVVYLYAVFYGIFYFGALLQLIVNLKAGIIIRHYSDMTIKLDMLHVLFA